MSISGLFENVTAWACILMIMILVLGAWNIIERLRYRRDNHRADEVCDGVGERIVGMYMCDPFLTDIDKKIAIQLYTFTKIIADEIVCVYAGVNDEKYKDYIKTADGIKRVDLVERGVRMLPDGQSEDFLRLITWK